MVRAQPRTMAHAALPARPHGVHGVHLVPSHPAPRAQAIDRDKDGALAYREFEQAAECRGDSFVARSQMPSALVARVVNHVGRKSGQTASNKAMKHFALPTAHWFEHASRRKRNQDKTRTDSIQEVLTLCFSLLNHRRTLANLLGVVSARGLSVSSLSAPGGHRRRHGGAHQRAARATRGGSAERGH